MCLPMMPIGQLEYNVSGVVHVEDVLDNEYIDRWALHEIPIPKHHFIGGFWKFSFTVFCAFIPTILKVQLVVYKVYDLVLSVEGESASQRVAREASSIDVVVWRIDVVLVFLFPV